MNTKVSHSVGEAKSGSSGVDSSGAYDVVVIGTGPGGYVAAIRAAQLGHKVACIDQRATPGGTCLNVGCIPSKALLASSEKFAETKHHLAQHGIKLPGVTLDLPAMMARKNQVVNDNVSGLTLLFRKNRVDSIRGWARITAPGIVNVVSDDASCKRQQVIRAKSIVIATGATSSELAGVTVDERSILSSTGALELERVPSSLVVIGGGYIGLEIGSVWSRLGSKVTVVEFLDRILPGMDRELSKQMQRILERQGLRFRLSTKVTAAHLEGDQVHLQLDPAGQSDKAAIAAPEIVKAEKVLVAVGRKPYTDGLGLDELGVKCNQSAQIVTDSYFHTSVPGIYAIGDVIQGPMLAHKAEDEGVAVAEILAGQSGHVNYSAIPSVVYTWPEVAQVGQTQEQLTQLGVDYRIGRFPLSANSRARAGGFTDGMVMLLADKSTDRLLGASIIGPQAGTMIGELALAMEFSASAEDIARTCHAHPTLSEAIKEAALAVDERTIHL